jgi:PAS domain S-box-containing protein
LGIGLATLEGEILSVNPTLARLTGFTEHELLGSNVINLYHQPEQRVRLARQLTADAPLRDYGVAIERKDGSVFNASLNATVISQRERHVILTLLEDVTEQMQAERLLRDSEAAAAERAAVNAERGRLARDLHDSTTQALYSAMLFNETEKKLAAAGDLESAAYYRDRVGQVVQQALREMRLLVFELRPPVLEREGLVGALRLRLDTVEHRAGVNARLDVGDLPTLPGNVIENLYRIALEALNNSLKHAGAEQVIVRLWQVGDAIALEVADDGQGFDPTDISDKGGFGLVSVRERVDRLGGELTITSAPGEGTTIRVVLGQDSSSEG